MPDAIEALETYLVEHHGQLGQEQVPLGIQALKEFLQSGAAMGRGWRQRITAKCRPMDEYGTALVYLFVIVVDGAVHEGRLGPIEAYVNGNQLLSREAEELLSMLQSDHFTQQMGWRPTRPGDKKPL